MPQITSSCKTFCHRITTVSEEAFHSTKTPSSNSPMSRLLFFLPIFTVSVIASTTATCYSTTFYNELMGSLCLTMMYDIFEPHAQRDATDTHSDRTAYIVRQLTDLLATGISRTEREVSYYAERLNVSPKYLSATVKRVTGHSVSSYINRATVPILKGFLDNERLSLTQIADRMNFTSLSYFSRYCTKHLGQSPSEYRRSLQPKG